MKRRFYPFFKRLFDIVGAAFGLVVLSPVLLCVAILVKKKLGSPVIFKQTRAGYKGNPFTINKFRTMTDERDEEGNVVYTTEIAYRKDKEHLLLSWRDMVAQNEGDFGFHYDPYNFDSSPEQDFFRQVLHAINVEPEQVEDIYFTGGLTDPNKTEFYIEYKGEDGRWHRYSPDFVVRRKDGRCYIVEIKAERERNHPVDGEHGRKAMAVRRWEHLNPDRLRYEIIFTDSDSVAFNQLAPVRGFIQNAREGDK